MNRDHNGRCIKRRYRTRAKAEKARRAMSGRGLRSAYYHHECDAWHVTRERPRLHKNPDPGTMILS